MITLALDVFGGDNAPAAVIDAAAQALRDFSDIRLALCGEKSAIEREITRTGIDASRVDISDAPEVIGMDESPVSAIRVKKNSSIVRAMQLVADKSAQAAISAGSTGAILAGATFIVKRLPGVKRPALTPVLPTLGENPVMLIDSGANADCKPEYLEQFGIMGSAYMENVMKIKNPRVGLLNIGAEAEKGDELRKAAYPLLQSVTGINFVGNCEARDLLSGNYDVVVADGFSGNIALKLTEGVAGFMLKTIKTELMASTVSKLGAALCKPAFKNVKAKLDYSEYGGAILLGVNGGVIKAHGSSDAHAFYSAIRQAREFVSNGVVEITQTAVARQLNK